MQPPARFRQSGSSRSPSACSQSDVANHQYDIEDFFSALNAGNLPAVSFLKAIGTQDSHPGYSSPLDEQVFVVTVLNTLQQSDFGRARQWLSGMMTPTVRMTISRVRSSTNPTPSPTPLRTTVPAVTTAAIARGPPQSACSRPLRLRSAYTVLGRIVLGSAELR